MTNPQRHDITIVQGATFAPDYYWYSQLVSKAITAVTPGLPTSFTATAHGLPTQPVPAWFQSLKGSISQINTLGPPGNVADGEYTMITRTSVNTFDALLLNTDGLVYTSGGYVLFYGVRDLTGYTGRAQIRATRESTATLVDLTTANTGIVIDAANGAVGMRITAAATAALDFSCAVYDLELIDGSGAVTRLMYGDVKLFKETTR